MPKTGELLRRHRDQQAVERLLMGEEWGDRGLVWPSRSRVSMGSSIVSAVWRRLRDQAGLPPCGLHALRHAAASLQLQAGVGIREIAATLGHESPDFTARTYAHVLEQTKRQAAEKFGRLLDKG